MTSLLVGEGRVLLSKSNALQAPDQFPFEWASVTDREIERSIAQRSRSC